VEFMVSLRPAINKLSREAGEGEPKAPARFIFASWQMRSSSRRAGSRRRRAGVICEWVQAVTHCSRDGEVGKGSSGEMFAPQPSGYF